MAAALRESPADTADCRSEWDDMTDDVGGAGQPHPGRTSLGLSDTSGFSRVRPADLAGSPRMQSLMEEAEREAALAGAQIVWWADDFQPDGDRRANDWGWSLADSPRDLRRCASGLGMAASALAEMRSLVENDPRVAAAADDPRRDEVAEAGFSAVCAAAERLAQGGADPREVGCAAASAPGAGVLRIEKVADIVDAACSRSASAGLTPADSQRVLKGVRSVMGENTDDALRRVDAAHDRIDMALDELPFFGDHDDRFMHAQDVHEDAAGCVMTRAEVRAFAGDRAMSSLG